MLHAWTGTFSQSAQWTGYPKRELVVTMLAVRYIFDSVGVVWIVVVVFVVVVVVVVFVVVIRCGAVLL